MSGHDGHWRRDIVGRASIEGVRVEVANVVTDEEFWAQIAAMQDDARQRQSECGKRAGPWALYAIASGIIAAHVPGWWSFACWCSMLIWGVGALFQLEAANVARIESTLGPFD